MSETRFELVGAVVPSKSIASFAVPVFRRGGQDFIQSLTPDGLISSFLEADSSDSVVVKAPNGHTRAAQENGMWAFWSGEKLLCGTREQLGIALRPSLQGIQDRPFALLEVGEFLKDGELIQVAKRLAEQLVRDTASDELRIRRTPTYPAMTEVMVTAPPAREPSGWRTKKEEIIEYIAKSVDGITRKTAGEAFDAAIDAIAKGLKKGERVQIPGFGSFSVSKRAARRGRNPATGATITVKASKNVRFKAGKELKDALNRGKR